MKNISLYIHIPFCQKKCYYCDFVSSPKDDDYIREYVDAVIAELELKSHYFTDYIIKTLFIGGGSPSKLMCGELTRIVDAINNFYHLSPEEFSIEVNPVSFDYNHIKEYLSLGVNRISVGIQSLDDRVLKTIGRANTALEGRSALGLATMYFKNVNADIMIGLPEQTVPSLVDTLHEVIRKKLQHISCYSLILEENTPMYKMHLEGQIKIPDSDFAANMYNVSSDILQANGYNCYEISNFAKKGYECKHNLVYWKRQEYIGIGVAAHSLFMDKRIANIENTDNYIKSIKEGRLAVAEEIQLYNEEKKEETIMLALRLEEGLDIEKFNKEFNTDFLQEYDKKIARVHDYITIQNNRLTVKPEHYYVSNSIISELI